MGRLSAASPLPLVFGNVSGLDYWASRPRLAVATAAGERAVAELGPGAFERIPGPHRYHLALAIPLAAAPVLAEEWWRPVLVHSLCDGGVLAHAFGLPEDGLGVELTLASPGPAAEEIRFASACP